SGYGPQKLSGSSTPMVLASAIVGSLGHHSVATPWARTVVLGGSKMTLKSKLAASKAGRFSRKGASDRKGPFEGCRPDSGGGAIVWTAVPWGRQPLAEV